MTNSDQFDAFDDCEIDQPNDLQKLIEKENAPTCKIIEETLTINLGNENNPQNIFIGSTSILDQMNAMN